MNEKNNLPRDLGFILTAHGEDTQGKHELHYYGRGLRSAFVLIFDNQRPTLFIERECSPQECGVSYERKNLALFSFSQKPMDACYFKTQGDLYKFRDAAGVRTYEADIRTTERFLMERFIKGFIEFSGPFQEEKGVKVFRNPMIKKSEKNFSPSLSTLSFDIETSGADELFSIALHYKGIGERGQKKDIRRVYMVGEDQGPMPEESKGSLFYFSDEKSCYLQFEEDFHSLDPDFILGWHVVGFDLAFLERKCLLWGIKLNLGRRRSRVLLTQGKGNTKFARLKGRVVVDGPHALRSSFWSFESWKLDDVAHELLGVGKDIQGTGKEKIREIQNRFRENKPSLAHYNLLDCTLVTDIVEKTGLLSLMQKRVELSGLLVDRQALSTAAFDFFMLPRLHRKGYIAPNTIDIVRSSSAAGGYVIRPESGLKEHVFVFDFKSLYPSIIRTFFIDPYGLLKREVNPVKNPAGISFSRTENFLSDFMADLMGKREKAKGEGDSHLSQAIKILMNSFYGVMGSSGSRFYQGDLPTAITETGQWILRSSADFFENEGLCVVYGDTDSLFVKMNSGEGFKEKGKLLAKKLNEYLKKTLLKNFKVDSFLELEFEKYYRKIFFPELRTGEGGAKKRYVGLCFHEGREEIQFSGMEFVRSDWTKMAKNFQYELFEEYFKEGDIMAPIKSVVEKLKRGELDDFLVYRKKLSKDLDQYTKSLPPHVKAAKKLQEAGHEFGRNISYVYTRRGPTPLELEHDDLDYQHYIEKQIRPLAEVVLFPLGISFDSIVEGNQLDLFSE